MSTSLPANWCSATSSWNWSISVTFGRSVCALGDSVAEAQRRAYERVADIDWEGMFCRRDIGYRAIS